MAMVLLVYVVYVAGFPLDYGLGRILRSPPIADAAVATIVLIVTIRLIDRVIP